MESFYGVIRTLSRKTLKRKVILNSLVSGQCLFNYLIDLNRLPIFVINRFLRVMNVQ